MRSQAVFAAARPAPDVRIYRSIECAYVQRLSTAYRIYKHLPDAEVAAAICYRWADKKLQFLLVHTKDGQRWTFPKGHQRQAETLPETAVREAAEEAGVRKCNVEGKRLCEYRYPPTRSWQRDGGLVAAFLVEVKETGQPSGEPFRTPTWHCAEEAGFKLGEGREPQYAEETDRLLLAAGRAAEHSRA